MKNNEKQINRKVIYIGGFELPDKNAAAQRVVSNAKALREMGYTVVFIDINREEDRDILDTKSDVFGFERYSMRYTNNRLFSITELRTIYQLYEGEVFAVIAYNYPGVALGKMNRFCKKCGVKLIADCTEWYGAQGESLIKKVIKGMDSFIRMSIVHPKLDGMIAISSYLLEFYKHKLPTVCIPPLVDITENKWTLTKEKKCEEIDIVYAGTPGRDKDKLNLIVEAIGKIDLDLKFTVIGITREQFLEYYPEHEQTLSKVGRKVNFIGRIPHVDVISYIKRADFTMFYREVNRITMAGFPTKFAESITCGTPVITNKTSDLMEYLIEGRNGYWLSEDIGESLNVILNELKRNKSNMKQGIDRTVFDYHRYIPLLNQLFGGDNRCG